MFSQSITSHLLNHTCLSHTITHTYIHAHKQTPFSLISLINGDKALFPPPCTLSLYQAVNWLNHGTIVWPFWSFQVELFSNVFKVLRFNIFFRLIVNIVILGCCYAIAVSTCDIPKSVVEVCPLSQCRKPFLILVCSSPLACTTMYKPETKPAN